MPSPVKALLDANVLYSNHLRNLLLLAQRPALSHRRPFDGAARLEVNSSAAASRITSNCLVALDSPARTANNAAAGPAARRRPAPRRVAQGKVRASMSAPACAGCGGEVNECGTVHSLA
jgi:hypothetical protein